jgi:hypothetical protein
MAQQSEFIESINIDSLKIIKLAALCAALGATINSNIIYLVKLRLRQRRWLATGWRAGKRAAPRNNPSSAGKRHLLVQCHLRDPCSLA